jgi:dihydrofolate synthase/folylpolyglutamate synthase
VRFREALAELEARQPLRMVPDLDRIGALAELLDHPELAYPTLHVTGTNGKTTTARVATALACAHGLTTGTFVSPHLDSVTERLSVCGEPIEEEDFGEELERLLPYLHEIDRRGERVTYFEALTALAYLWFSEKPVGLGVFEVGMGGTWDATNLVSGDVAVICPIDLDHPELGSTVAEVAREKAGIIKEGRAAVVREQPPEAQAVLETRAQEVGARLLLEGPDFSVPVRAQAVGGQALAVRGIHATYRDLALPLFGEHAARNAAAAVAALETLLDRALDEEAVREAFSEVRSPGRLEIVGRRPLLVLDGAHNPAGASALVAALRESFTWLDLYVVLSISSDKDVDGIVAELAPVVSRALVARNSSPRAAAPEIVLGACENAGLDASVRAGVEDALDSALAEAREEDLILVTGSLYTVADARRAISTHGR